MQKKIIALAVAGLVSGAAFAQSNVTVYGIIDMAYQYQGGNVAPGGDSYSGFDSGGWDGSRFRFKGTEELGNGLSVGFDTEFDFRTDYVSDSVDVAKNHLFLAGKNWGMVKAGSFGNSLDDVLGYAETGMGYGNKVIGLAVFDSNYNAVKYISPSWSGFSFNAAYSTNNQDSNETVTSDANVDDDNLEAFDIGASYVNGGLKIGFGYENSSMDQNDVDADEWVLTGGYNFGMFQVGVGYGNIDASSDVRDADRDAWLISAGWSITPNDQLAVSYSASSWDYKTAAGVKSDYDADAWGISYTHALSKRTSIYATGYVADADKGFLGQDGYDDTTYSGYENGFKVGVRHLF